MSGEIWQQPHAQDATARRLLAEGLGPVEAMPGDLLGAMHGILCAVELMVLREQVRRQHRGAVKLVAAGGHLTVHGRRHVRALKAARTRAGKVAAG